MAELTGAVWRKSTRSDNGVDPGTWRAFLRTVKTGTLDLA
jgi:hypothetical protein